MNTNQTLSIESQLEVERIYNILCECVTLNRIPQDDLLDYALMFFVFNLNKRADVPADDFSKHLTFFIDYYKNLGAKNE